MQQANVFISYARRDGLEYAERLEAALNQAGIPTWRDKRGLDPWQDFTSQIEDAINEASHVALCLTPDSKRDDSFVRREIQAALLHNSVPLIQADGLEVLCHHQRGDSHGRFSAFDSGRWIGSDQRRTVSRVCDVSVPLIQADGLEDRRRAGAARGRCFSAFDSGRWIGRVSIAGGLPIAHRFSAFDSGRWIGSAPRWCKCSPSWMFQCL